MILTALPALPGQTKSSIQQNIAQILQLHEDLLAELQQAVPQADFTKVAQTETYPVTKAKHIRFHSADIMPGRLGEHKATRRLRHSLELGRSPDKRPRGLVTDTKTVGNIAKIFNHHVGISVLQRWLALTSSDETLLHLRRIRCPLDDHVFRSYNDVQRASWLARVRTRGRGFAKGRCVGKQSRGWKQEGAKLPGSLDQGKSVSLYFGDLLMIDCQANSKGLQVPALVRRSMPPDTSL